MTGTTVSSEGLDVRRRRLLYRSWHRGTREMDLVLGPFADSAIAAMTDAELDAYEHLSDAPDPSLHAWITGELPVPPDYDTDMFRRIHAFARGKR